MAWDIKEEYFTGQGTVLISKRDKNGQPLGFRHLGNVASLAISTARNYNSHKESKSGSRSTDRRTITDTTVTLSAACENFSSENVRLFTGGVLTKIAAGSVVDAIHNGAAGLITGLDHISVSDVSVKIGSQALVAYTNASTPYDFEVNKESGSIKLNPAGANLTVPVTDIVVGTTTTITAAIGDVSVGDIVTLSGVTGTDAGDLNGVPLTVTQVNQTGVVVSLDTTGKVVVGTAAKLSGTGLSLKVSYTFGEQDIIDALAAKEESVWLRFEGLNTAEDDKPVVVDIFKLGITPIAELALFGDAIQQANVSGEVFTDSDRTTGSKFYSVRKL
ncbi:MAG: hypothetical protein RR280_04370 [Bacteroidaceae bacterium]